MAGYISIAAMLVLSVMMIGKVTNFELKEMTTMTMSERRGKFCDNSICNNQKVDKKALNIRCARKCQQAKEINGAYARETGQCVGKQCCCSNKRLKKNHLKLGNIKGSKGKRGKNGKNSHKGGRNGLRNNLQNDQDDDPMGTDHNDDGYNGQDPTHDDMGGGHYGEHSMSDQDGYDESYNEDPQEYSGGHRSPY